MRGRALTAAAVILAGSLAATWTTGRDDAAEAATVNRTVLSDSFSGDRGDRPDDDVWAVAGGGRRSTAVLDGNGRLALGAVLRTGKTFTQAYGRAEARISMWRQDGAWRALGVLDDQGRIPAGTVETLASDRVDENFHTYAVDWTPTTLTWSVDGRKVIRFTRAEKGTPLVFVLNLASGGYYSGGMLVDWVTVRTPVQVRDAAKWKPFTAYKAGQLVGYRKVVYRVREAHTSLPGWQPDLVPALFAKD
ncbi:family 16 glycosylhydrolase [Actinoplanes subglobosus]|uniref:Family 16 glycosylhydrolase n=1 Tax=Actinoplanes subglobosus TaxID=1547892 RepID=A0ABV8ITP0_9ACTN